MPQGDPNTYQRLVEPYLSDIRKWYGEGKSKQSIAKRLGISMNSLMKYQREREELYNAFATADHSRDALVMDRYFELTQGKVLYDYKYKTDPVTGNEILVEKNEKETLPQLKAIQGYIANRRLSNGLEEELLRAKIRQAKADADIKEDIANKLANGESVSEALMALVNLKENPDTIAPEPERVDESLEVTGDDSAK